MRSRSLDGLTSSSWTAATSFFGPARCLGTPQKG